MMVAITDVAKCEFVVEIDPQAVRTLRVSRMLLLPKKAWLVPVGGCFSTTRR
jgi:hypothetical protein